MKPTIRLLALLGLSAVWLVLSCTSVLAHAELLESEPEDGVALDQALNQVRLRFNEPIEATFNPLEVRDSQSNRADEDNARVDPEDARVLVADLKELPEGPYSAEWRITSIDGHVIGDTFDFTVTNSDVSELPADVEEPVSESSGQGVTTMAIIGVLGLSIVAALGVVLRRRR